MARVKTGSSSSCVRDIRLALDGFMRDDATLTWMEGSALGGSKRSGNSSVTSPRKILVRSAASTRPLLTSVPSPVRVPALVT